MKLSGHSYDNDIFNSLLDGLKDDVVLKKKASTKSQDEVSGMDVFSSTTEKTLQGIHEEDLKFIVAELQYAADAAKVAISQEDLLTFVDQVKKGSLRGKDMERAARKYCGNLQREIAPPQGATHRSEGLTDQLSHLVTPAGYNPEFGPSEHKAGGYMGMSKNPNTIWDSGELAKLAEKPYTRHEMYGDEKIKESHAKKEEFQKNMKDEQWQEKQAALSDENMLHKKVANVSTGKEIGTDQKLPGNAMSIFDNKRDFENIPEKTAGEQIKEQKEERATKIAEAKEEWNYTKSAMKTDNNGDFLFRTVEEKTKPERSASDKLFEELLKRGI